MDLTLFLAWESIRVSLGEEVVISLDWEGRPFSIYLKGRFFRIGLDGMVLEKWRTQVGDRTVRMRKRLRKEQSREVIQRIETYLKRTERELRSLRGRILFDGVGKEALHDAISLFSQFKSDKLEEHQRSFHRVYERIGILPPDQYLSLVVQVTEGCHWNRCTFCGFYRGERFRMKDQKAFKGHLKDVKAFLGKGLRLRRSIFLSEANALIAPRESLRDHMGHLHREFQISPHPLKGREVRQWLRKGETHFEGIYSFVDTPTGRRLPLDELIWLRRMGLRRVYLGLETGSRQIQRLLNKPGSVDEAVASVLSMKRAGLNIGIIIMLGIGGKRLSSEHIRETARVLMRMGLDVGDLIYLSPYVGVPGTEYPNIIKRLGLKEMNHQDLLVEKENLLRLLEEQGLRKGIPKIALYDIEEFLY